MGDGVSHAVVWTVLPRLANLHIETTNDTSWWGIGTRQRLAWTYDGDAPQFQIDISRDGGDTWDFLSVVPNRVGGFQNFFWTVTGRSTPNARLRVTAVGDNESTDVNDADIRIGPAAIDILRPSGRTVVAFGSAQDIFFRHNLGARKPVAIDVSDNGGGTWRTIVKGTPTKGSTTSSYPWVVDVLPTARTRVRVRALDGSGVSAVSNLFTVLVAEPIQITDGAVRGDFDERFGSYSLEGNGFHLGGLWFASGPCSGVEEPLSGRRRGGLLQNIRLLSVNRPDSEEGQLGILVIGNGEFVSAEASFSETVKPVTVRDGEVTLRFTMRGTARGFSADGQRVAAEATIFGQGTVSVEFLRTSDERLFTWGHFSI
jgi:hypothetical protein